MSFSEGQTLGKSKSPWGKSPSLPVRKTSWLENTREECLQGQRKKPGANTGVLKAKVWMCSWHLASPHIEDLGGVGAKARLAW